MSEPYSVDFEQWLIDLRQTFHRIPELNFKEVKTAAVICQVLDQLGVDYQRDIAHTGVVAHLRANTAGPRIAFRADMDALPMDEKTHLPFQSQHPGCMHACGHDGHMAIALGLIRQLIEQGWSQQGKGEIFFIFQPAEEKGAGARAMLQSGFFDHLPMDAVFALHLDPRFPAGSVELLDGPGHAAADTLEIKIEGWGGHGASPHLCHDPIVAAAYLITTLQTLVSRKMDPMQAAVLTIGQIHSGTAANIIPHEVRISGTLRTLRREDRQHLLDRIQAILSGLETSHTVSCHLEISDSYPVLINHPELATRMRSVATSVLGADRIIAGSPRMGAEDFAFFCQRWPGIMVAVGCHDPAEGYQSGLHSPHFQLDENALMVAVRLFTHTLSTYADTNFEKEKS